jgi:cytoskeleton protein RodZ
MPSIGEQLKLARETRKLTLKQVVQATRIRAHYLEAMEMDDFLVMPSAAQARGFLRSYAEFLGLDAEELINRQRHESTAPAEFSAPASQTSPAAPAIEETGSQPEPEPIRPAPEPEPEPIPVEAIPEPLKADAQTQSQLIFVEIGEKLRQRRELLSLTHDEIERHTRVRKHYLVMVEAGIFDELPSPVQARGMLSTYASFLDMDTDALLLRFADALQARRQERQAATPQKSSLPRQRFMLPLWLRRFISPDLIFGGGMILLIFILAIWFAMRILATQKTNASPTEGPSISDVLLATRPVSGDLSTTPLPTGIAELGTPLPDLGGEQSTPTETSLPPTPAGAVQITISVLERTYLRVSVDGEIKQDGRVVPGAALTFQGAERIEILTGSGAAVQIIFNQQNLGILGNFGEVVNRIFTVNGQETPTLTASPTPSITPRPSRTLRPSLTPRPTSTARPTLKPSASPTGRP